MSDPSTACPCPPSRPANGRFRSLLARLAGSSLVAMLLLGFAVPPAQAAGGDFTVDFVAAAPFTYNHGGRGVPMR
jgi:hypothetical protein